ncbi:MAG: hypothetical protein IKC05_01105, partial [Lentisphaeria bacterium]|nr:hypothetical protein [Lentisphaeria bacterium]
NSNTQRCIFLKVSEKKPVAQQNATGLEATKKLLHGADDQTIAINSTFDGDTEESVVPNVLAARTGSRSAGRSATSQNQSHSSDSSNDEKLFHFFSPCIVYCSGYAGKTGATEKSFL